MCIETLRHDGFVKGGLKMYMDFEGVNGVAAVEKGTFYYLA
jgi:hypothetical protein